VYVKDSFYRDNPNTRALTKAEILSQKQYRGMGKSIVETKGFRTHQGFECMLHSMCVMGFSCKYNIRYRVKEGRKAD
jgi:hypothetical protein